MSLLGSRQKHHSVHRGVWDILYEICYKQGCKKELQKKGGGQNINKKTYGTGGIRPKSLCGKG